MKIIHLQSELDHYLKGLPEEKSIGFVPTMGALHSGHLSLLKKAAEKDDITVCSIFVNPTQFNEKSDYDAYPQVLDEDVALLKNINVDVVFAPTVQQIYPNGTERIPYYDIGFLDDVLEGKHRPGHFQGVCHIIDVFLKMIKPEHIYMGEKDFQQIAVVRKLIDLNSHQTELVPCATLREESGLAMSSRNTHLSKAGKEKAATFFKSLSYIKDGQHNKNFNALKQEAETMLRDNDFIPEYIALCEEATLKEILDFDPSKKMRLIGAAFIEGVRLIDNIAV